MARPIPEADLNEILAIVARRDGGASVAQIAQALATPGARRTLQYRLRTLVDTGRLRLSGEGRTARYHVVEHSSVTEPVITDIVPLSPEGEALLAYVRQPVAARKPVGYARAFLDGYRPNETFYLTEEQRAHLASLGKPRVEAAPAGTYAKQILSRLLIDLAWNSSRLEGNTYSLLDTRRLLDFGEAAAGHGQREAQMILNHKDAIEFLVAAADDIGFNRYTILNLHALLANNLLTDPVAVGRLRHIVVGIDGSTFHPLEVPGMIEECFDQLLATAEAINDPFEQSFFFMVQLPYLQPFDDVNKRVSRLAANIPMIRANLAPLSFTDVPGDLYITATLGVYERTDIALLRDVYLWAYERSAARYAAVRQSLGDPDPFRLRYRDTLRQIIRNIIREASGRPAARTHLTSFVSNQIPTEDQEQFVEVAETELLGLHEGNFARYQVRPSEFARWQAAWAQN
ncbi:Fic family protein [Sphingobium sp. 15-1]|uniref:Fic family protein n=1 Tax=Sphingobium sp. 15-1 TaxID=2729616 RepID=UPI00159C4B77|nr:Fic family protein [Sphingobium sp. 15-1]